MTTDARPIAPREAEILTLIAEGLTRAQIAARLRISIHTVAAALRYTRRKLGAHTTTQAVTAAYRRGDLPCPCGRRP